jgi:hypothetical protein
MLTGCIRHADWLYVPITTSGSRARTVLTLTTLESADQSSFLASAEQNIALLKVDGANVCLHRRAKRQRVEVDMGACVTSTLSCAIL